MKVAKNIHPVFKRILQRNDKEDLLQQRAIVIWLTGLSGSGKTTIGAAVERQLHNMGYLTQVLDGDNIRSGINNNLTFTKDDRSENIRRVAEVSKLLLNCGVIAINCFISPRKEMRELARGIIGDENFFEVFISAPLTVCENRDVKGLYKKARAGEIKNFTGIDAPFETPIEADIEVRTDILTIQEVTDIIVENILPKIQFNRG